ncbi:MAG TPA: ATP phosphoribosyltransferase [Pseudomonadales bacterium]|nr:ATP phosphoribosyltransferase [Pseudomonadales bacterium]
MDRVTLALTRGDRILADELKLLSSIGIEPDENIEKSRKLVFGTSRPGVELMVLRGSDVPTYVEHGVADIGICGKDVLLEHGEEGYYQPLDLKIGHCRMMVAGFADEPPLPRRIKVASKFVNTAKRYYADLGIQVDVIKLYGAMELAPIVGLAHRIVDIVETGNTLKANGLVPLDHICDISTRLIVNKVSMKMKHETVQKLVEEFAGAVEAL